MKRYTLSTIIGTGLDEDSFRPAVTAYPCNWVVAIAPDHQTNPNKRWVICVVAATQATLTAMDTDPSIDVLPFGYDDLPMIWTSLGTNQQRTTWANAIRTRTGVTVSRDDPRTLRDIVQAIGSAVDSNFQSDNLNVTDWAGA